MGKQITLWTTADKADTDLEITPDSFLWCNEAVGEAFDAASAHGHKVLRVTVEVTKVEVVHNDKISIRHGADWEDASYGNGGQMICELVVNGCSLHLEAFEVRPVFTKDGEFDGEYVAIDSSFDADVEFIYSKAEGCVEVMSYNGKLWMVLATPYGR